MLDQIAMNASLGSQQSKMVMVISHIFPLCAATAQALLSQPATPALVQVAFSEEGDEEEGLEDSAAVDALLHFSEAAMEYMRSIHIGSLSDALQHAQGEAEGALTVACPDPRGVAGTVTAVLESLVSVLPQTCIAYHRSCQVQRFLDGRDAGAGVGLPLKGRP